MASLSFHGNILSYQNQNILLPRSNQCRNSVVPHKNKFRTVSNFLFFWISFNLIDVKVCEDIFYYIIVYTCISDKFSLKSSEV